jgi:hypothetical protein
LPQGGDDEDEDLFNDNEEDGAAAEELKAKAAAAKEKSKGDKPPAKTNIILDVKGMVATYVCGGSDLKRSDMCTPPCALEELEEKWAKFNLSHHL